MLKEDSICLLRECDAGVKMGVDSIRDTLDQVKSPKLRLLLERSRDHHENLGREIEELLADCREEGKDPSMMAKSMSHMKTDVKLGLDPSDRTIARLITDGCDMGTKSLCRYMNEYAAAEKEARELALRLIDAEDELRMKLREYL